MKKNGELQVMTHGPRKQTRDRQEKRRRMEAEPRAERQTTMKKKETKKAKSIAKTGQRRVAKKRRSNPQANTETGILSGGAQQVRKKRTLR